MPEATKPPPPVSPWTPEVVRGILSEVVVPLGNRFMELKEKEIEFGIKAQAAESKASWWVLFILMVFLAIVIALMVWLVLNDRVSGDALLFLVGTVSGYVLAMVQRHLFPEVIEVPEA